MEIPRQMEQLGSEICALKSKFIYRNMQQFNGPFFKEINFVVT
jgi:hypothetical protein